jgi:VanZ family protein
MKELKYLRFWLILGWGMVFLVAVLSLIPSPQVLGPVLPSDIVIHLLAYSSLMLWFGCIYSTGRRYLILGLVLILIGIVLEFLQGMTSYRCFEYKDMLVNFFGVLLGWLLSMTRISSFLIFVEQRIMGSWSKR